MKVYGIGPVYGIAVIATTVVAWTAVSSGVVPDVELPFATLWRILGWALVPAGAALWVFGALGSGFLRRFNAGELATSGAFAWVRNPLYVSLALICSGLALSRASAWLLLLPVMYWALLTGLVRATEERWCRARFGDEYLAYCARVNRAIPWPPTWPKPWLRGSPEL